MANGYKRNVMCVGKGSFAHRSHSHERARPGGMAIKYNITERVLTDSLLHYKKAF